MVPCHIDFKWLRGPILSGQCLSFARATFLFTGLPLVHPCGDQESSSWLGSWPLMLPVDKGCLQGASRAPGEGNGTPTPVLLHGKCHGWRSLVGCSPCGRRARLSDFTFTFQFHALEKEMATHSSVLAWGIPGMAEPGGLPSMGSHRVRHDWRDLAAAAPAPFIMSPSTGILMLDCALPSLNVIVFPVYFLPRSHVCALSGHVPPPLDASPKSTCFWRCVLNADFPIKPSLMAQLKESCLLCVSLEPDQRWLFLGEACGSCLPCVTASPSAAVSQHTPALAQHLHPLDGWFAQNHCGKFWIQVFTWAQFWLGAHDMLGLHSVLHC